MQGVAGAEPALGVEVGGCVHFEVACAVSWGGGLVVGVVVEGWWGGR